MLQRLVLWIVVAAVAIAAAIAGGLAAERHLRARALEGAFARLMLFHELRRAALEDYLRSMASDVRAASENPRVVEATENLTFAFQTLGPEARQVLPQLYIAGNPYPDGEKEKLERADDNSYYSRYHGDFHGWARRFRAHFGYYDVFLLSPRGDILYTVAKESDFATNLKTGPYRQSSLADAFRRAIADPGAVAFSDFGRYPPSDDAPAAFAARAVVKDGKAIGVFAVQIPAEPLNELMHFTAGMGESGETYLVGPDGLMRSQSRFTTKPTVLAVKVDNHSVQDGQSGMSGKYVVADYRGIPVLSVFAPVDFGGQPFVLLAEIEEAEVLRESRGWIVFAAAALSALVAALAALLLYALIFASGREAAPNPAL